VITTNVEVLQDNRLIGTHVFKKGDVATVPEARAKELLKLKHVALTNRPATPLPTPVSRSEKLRQLEESMLRDQEEAEQATTKKARK
jgi:hypothetical protein